MFVAKIIRHRHKMLHYLNNDLKEVVEETHFKIIFSHPGEMRKFEKWCILHQGKYDYDKEAGMQKGTFPKINIFKEEICWCDLMAFYLLHVAGYDYHSSLSPYKGEVYIKNPD